MSPGNRETRDAGIDRVLREVLRDDLPAYVEARLERRLRGFLPPRKRTRLSILSPLPLTRTALAVAATLLLVTGLGLQAIAAPDAAGEPLRGISVSVSLHQALKAAPFLKCSGMSDAALDTPAALAEAVYRSWVPVSVLAGAQGTLVATYRSTATAAEYELVLDGATLLPREVLRRGGLDGSGEATCVWPAAAGGGERR